MTAAPLPPLQSRWLAEVVRRHEERHGPLDDAELLPALARLPAEPEIRIRRRAELIGTREGWAAAVVRTGRHASLALSLAAVLAVLAGLGAATGVLGDGARPVNLVWALGGLLGLHLLGLLAWALGLVLVAPRRQPAAGGGLIGRAWLGCLRWSGRGAPAADLPVALGGLLAPSGALRWGLSALNHAWWALALAAAALVLVVLFALRRYGFVWETTILPAAAFEQLAAVLGALPAQFGLPMPDAATVEATGAGDGLGEDARRQWAGWLIGCVLAYGVLPRLLLALVCALAWRRALAGLRLDLAQPGYAALQARLLPSSARLGVSDPAPPAAAAQRPAAAAVTEAAGRVLGLELGADLSWPPPFAVAVPPGMPAEARIDSREQRRAWLAHFDAHPPRRLLVAVDGRQTPDRGSLGLIAELAARAGALRVWVLHPEHGHDRCAQWEAGLAAAGLAAPLSDAEAARLWIGEAA